MEMQRASKVLEPGQVMSAVPSGSAVQTSKVLELLAICGIIGPIFFTTVVIILGAIQPGYSHVTQPISALGAVGAPNAVVQDINFVVTGVLTLAFAFGIHRGISGGKGSRIGPSLVALFSVSAFIGSAVFPLTPCDQLQSCNSVTLLHIVLGLTGFAYLAGAALILSRRLKADDQWRSYRSYSLVSGLLMIVFLVAFIAASALQYYPGLIQRLLAGTFLLWIEVMAIKLFRISHTKLLVDT
jgi:hypothetical membrane protein